MYHLFQYIRERSHLLRWLSHKMTLNGHVQKERARSKSHTFQRLIFSLYFVNMCFRPYVIVDNRKSCMGSTNTLFHFE